MGSPLRLRDRAIRRATAHFPCMRLDGGSIGAHFDRDSLKRPVLAYRPSGVIKRTASMRRLAVLIFAAAIVIWGLASIPDGSGGNDKTLPGYRRGELAKTPNRALLTPMQKAAALRGAGSCSRGAGAGRGECVRPVSGCGSAGDLGDDL